MIFDKFIRWSAIASCFACFLTIAIWLTHGAPGPLSELGRHASPYTSLLNLVASSASPEIRQAVMGLTAFVVGICGALGLLLLTRGAAITVAQPLGRAVAWAGLCFAYLFFLCVTPPFVNLLPAQPIALLLDVFFFTILGLSFHEYQQFWLVHPRVISSDELAQLLVKLSAKERLAASAARKTYLGWFRKLAGTTDSQTQQEREFVKIKTLLGFVFGKKGLVTNLVIACALGLLWHSQVGRSFAVIFILLLLMLPLGSVEAIVNCHYEFGSPTERRSVEWVRMALLMFGVGGFLIFMPIFLVAVVGAMFAPEWLGNFDLAAIHAWSLLTIGIFGPLAIMAALVLSVLYRGTLDPRLVLGRFTLWTALGLSLTFIFVLIERAVSLQVVQWFQLPSETGGLVAGAMIAATFQPMRKRTEAAVSGWVSKVMPAAMLTGSARREAAVAVTDITGYTALSARDEPSAMLASALVQREARHLCDANDGQFIKSTGDGAIMVFHTADEALRAITALHAAIAQASAALKIPFELHSGLHWGEFVQTYDGDIYGQTVNVAARIADRAKASEIWISSTFTSKLHANTTSLVAMGSQVFKNVPNGVDCHMVGRA